MKSLFSRRPALVSLAALALLAIGLDAPATAQTALNWTDSGTDNSYPFPGGSDTFYFSYDPGGYNNAFGTFGGHYGPGTNYFVANPISGQSMFGFFSPGLSGGTRLVLDDPQHSELDTEFTSGSFADRTFTADFTVSQSSGIFDGYTGNGTATIRGIYPGASYSNYQGTYQATLYQASPLGAVPEPSSLVLLGLGMIPVGLFVRWRRARLPLELTVCAMSIGGMR